MKYLASKVVGLAALTVFGAGVSELALASHHQTVTAPPKPAISVAPTPSPMPQATPTPSATPAATPASTPTQPTAVTNSFVHLRANPTTSSTDLADLQAGTTVTLTGTAQGSWQPVLYQGTAGYIYTSYLNY